MTETASILDRLAASAREAERAEAEFRRTMHERAAELGRERALAFRRLNVVRSLVETVAASEAMELAVAAALASLRERLGWRDDTAAREEVLNRFASVAEAAFRDLHPQPVRTEIADASPPVASDATEAGAPTFQEELERFEDWYLRSRGTSFWVLFEHHMPDTPLVDF